MKPTKTKIKKIKPSNYYVDNEEFYEELKEWIIAKKQDHNLSVPETIAKKIMLIVEGYSYRSNFINYSFKDKMISDAIYTCIKYANRFDYKKYKNPFAYFTQIAWSCFVKAIKHEHKQLKLKKELFEQQKLDMFNNSDCLERNRNDTKYMFDSDLVKEEDIPFAPVVVKYKGKRYKFTDKKEYEKFSKKIALDKKKEN